MTTAKKKRFLTGTLGAGALTGAYLLGSLTLAPAFAQTPTPAPPATRQAEQQHDQQPSYAGSIQVPRQPDQTGAAEQSDQQEAQALASLAKITPDQANQAALAQFPGATLTKTELDDENGSLVYSVHLADSAGTAQDVKVDAGNGTVLQTEADGPEEREGGNPLGALEANEGQE